MIVQNEFLNKIVVLNRDSFNLNNLIALEYHNLKRIGIGCKIGKQIFCQAAGAIIRSPRRLLRVCLMIRVHLKPLEIAKLKKCAPSYISNIRKSLILKIFGIEGSSELFDDEIGKIGRKDTG